MSIERFRLSVTRGDCDPAGEWMRYSDHASELAEWKQRAERAEKYVAGQDVRSDFRTAGEMRAALDDARAELARVEGERDSIRNAVAEACMWSGCNSAKELREALDRNYKRATNAEKANTLLRAECEAWRRAAYGRALIDLYSSSSESIWPARAATDAAGALKGVES